MTERNLSAAEGNYADDFWVTADGTKYPGLAGHFVVQEWAVAPERLPPPNCPVFPDDGFENEDQEAEYKNAFARYEDVLARIQGVQLQDASEAKGHLAEALNAGFKLLRLNLRPGLHHVARV